MDSDTTKNSSTMLSNAGGRFVELLHRADDPCSWTVRRSKKFLWFRIANQTDRFLSREQALAFAQNIAG